MSFEEYQDLQGTGFQGGGGDPTPPEEEFFHSVYISGKSRKNHLNIEEKVEKFQVRGVEYNLDKVHMVITHTKEILAKIEQERGRDTIKCFSFKEGQPPWHGTNLIFDWLELSSKVFQCLFDIWGVIKEPQMCRS